jgi:hypothetical protein
MDSKSNANTFALDMTKIKANASKSARRRARIEHCAAHGS